MKKYFLEEIVIGAAKYIEKIIGDWSNVVGLPLYKLRTFFAEIKFAVEIILCYYLQNFGL